MNGFKKELKVLYKNPKELKLIQKIRVLTAKNKFKKLPKVSINSDLTTPY